MAKKQKRAAPPVEEFLGFIEFLVLAAVLRLGDDHAYGMSVFEAIRENAYPPISFGSVYTALERMTWKGYLEGELGNSEPVRGGRARKYYRVTGLGKKVLEANFGAMKNVMLIEKPAV